MESNSNKVDDDGFFDGLNYENVNQEEDDDAFNTMYGSSGDQKNKKEEKEEEEILGNFNYDEMSFDFTDQELPVALQYLRSNSVQKQDILLLFNAIKTIEKVTKKYPGINVLEKVKNLTDADITHLDRAYGSNVKLPLMDDVWRVFSSMVFPADKVVIDGHWHSFPVTVNKTLWYVHFHMKDFFMSHITSGKVPTPLHPYSLKRARAAIELVSLIKQSPSERKRAVVAEFDKAGFKLTLSSKAHEILQRFGTKFLTFEDCRDLVSQLVTEYGFKPYVKTPTCMFLDSNLERSPDVPKMFLNSSIVCCSDIGRKITATEKIYKLKQFFLEVAKNCFDLRKPGVFLNCVRSYRKGSVADHYAFKDSAFMHYLPSAKTYAKCAEVSKKHYFGFKEMDQAIIEDGLERSEVKVVYIGVARTPNEEEWDHNYGVSTFVRLCRASGIPQKNIRLMNDTVIKDSFVVDGESYTVFQFDYSTSLLPYKPGLYVFSDVLLNGNKDLTVQATNIRTLKNLVKARDAKSYFAGKYMYYEDDLSIPNNVFGRTHNGEGFPNSREFAKLDSKVALNRESRFANVEDMLDTIFYNRVTFTHIKVEMECPHIIRSKVTKQVDTILLVSTDGINHEVSKEVIAAKKEEILKLKALVIKVDSKKVSFAYSANAVQFQLVGIKIEEEAAYNLDW